VGAQRLCRVLCDNGRPDLAYQIATQTDYPSWGYMVSKGATTIWELWNGDTAEPSMNSGNHVMLVGDLIVWMKEYLAGIRPDLAQPGYKHIVLRPEPTGDLTFARATHRSPYGLIVSDWKKGSDGTFRWNITVPTNATATAYVPARNGDAISEGGRELSQVKGVKFLRLEGDRALLELHAGEYSLFSR
jgi:alpha-L-rhamnosidase